MVSTSVREVSNPSVSDETTQPMRRVVASTPVSSTTGFAFQVIPPRANDGEREAVALEAAMQSLVLDETRPVALEITGTGTAKRFIIRATSQAAMDHAKAHIHARYAQAEMRDLSSLDDPFVLNRYESVSVVELCAGAPSYQPMRAVEEESLKRKGADPMLGILASLGVSKDMRAVAQIVLVPAPPSWSRGSLRKAVEHPLESERMQQREALVQAGDEAPSTTGVMILFVVFIGLLLYSRFHSMIPAWVYQAGADVFLHGRWPELTAEQQGMAGGMGVALIVGIAALFIAVDQVKRRFFAKPIYDQRLVAQKTSRLAYRVRIRLYVISPGKMHSYRRLLFALLRRMARLTNVAVRQKLHFMGIVTRATMSRFVWLSRKIGINIQLRQKLASEGKKHKRNRTRQGFRYYRDLYWGAWNRERHGRSEQRSRRADRLSSLSAAYRQFDMASAGHFLPKRIADWRATLLMRQPKGIFAGFSGWYAGVSKSTHFITGDFLSMAWRLPHSIELADLPLVEQKRARTLLIPPCLIAEDEAQTIGLSEHAGYAFPFALPSSFFGFHTLIGGKSGEGKSTLMVHIAQLAMQSGSLFLLDPHGDLAFEVIRSVPTHRLRDVVFVDLGDKDFSIGLNPLDVTLGRDRDLTVASLVATFSHFWESGWGSRMEAPFRAALMTLFEANEAICKRDRKKGPSQQHTLLDVIQVLTDQSFCNDLLVDVQDRFINRFWHEYYEPLDLRQWRERIDPILTKMLQFETRVARRILGQGQSTINLSQLVADQKIIVVRLASSEAGAQTSPLVGATLLGLLMVSLREQSVLAEHLRVRMGIICDEFQSLPGADWTTLTAELRKYGGAAVLATQSFEYLNKVDPILLPTVLANTKQYFIFRMSADDARTIYRDLDVADADIVNLDSHMCYVRVTYQNQQQQTFSLRLQLPLLAPPARVTAMRDHCRRLYTRPATDVEKEIVAALGRNVSASVHRRNKAVEDEDTAKRKAVKVSQSSTVSSPSIPVSTSSSGLVSTVQQPRVGKVSNVPLETRMPTTVSNGSLMPPQTSDGNGSAKRPSDLSATKPGRNTRPLAGTLGSDVEAQQEAIGVQPDSYGGVRGSTQEPEHVTRPEQSGRGENVQRRVRFEPKSVQRERDKAYVESLVIAPLDEGEEGKNHEERQ